MSQDTFGMSDRFSIEVHRARPGGGYEQPIVVSSDHRPTIRHVAERILQRAVERAAKRRQAHG